MVSCHISVEELLIKRSATSDEEKCVMLVKNTSYTLLLFVLFCLFYSHTCFAANGLPISNMNCYDLIEKTNAILSSRENFRCSEPIFKKVAQNERVFTCYVDKKNIYRPANGLIILYESLTGETTTFGITLEMDDKIKFRQVTFVFVSLMLACGLSHEEIDQLANSSTYGAEEYYSQVWSSKLNRYYVLTGKKFSDEVYSFMLVAMDSL